MPIKKAILFAGVGFAVMPMAAHAQSTAGVATSAQPAATAPAGPAQTDSSSQSGLEDIVVTAQRRSQSLQDVPIAVSAISGAQAEKLGVGGTDALQITTPGLDYSRGAGNGAVPFIRGVGSVQNAAGTESPVAVYVDDVYMGTSAANLFSFNNIEQVEVLKGPQGTLFGRNATGGVIQVRTKKPSHDAAFDAKVGYGNYDTYDGNLYATGGLSDTLAVNFAATGHKQADGYGVNVITGDDIYKEWSYGFRGSILWEPSTRTTAQLIADYSRQRSQIGLNPTVNPGTISAGLGYYPGRYRSTGSSLDELNLRQGGVSLRIDHDLDFAKLVSISAHRHTDHNFPFDQDAGPVPLIISDTSAVTNSLSQELQLQSQKNSSFNWIVGVFYYRSKAGFDPVRAVRPLQTGANAFTDVNDRQTLNSYAGFGEINYEFLRNTTLTLGLRYTVDDYHLDVRRTDGLGVVTPGGVFSQDKSFDKFTYRAILNHKFTPDVMAYASYSRGFKSGGFNVASPGVAPGAPPVSPEVLDAYEVGLKTELFDRTVRFNIAAFHYNYSNLQVIVVGPATTSVVNAASARINGVDFDATIVPVRGLQIGIGGSFLDGKYKSFPNGPLFVPAPGVCGPVPMTTRPLIGGNLQCSADLSGNTTVRTPKFTATLSATYTVPTSIGDLGVSANIYHNSGFFWEADNRSRQPRHNLLNTTLTWKSLSGKYEFNVWGKNLLNAYYITYGSESVFRDSSSPALPRTYGVSAGVHF